jgi:hypothetical protein
MLNNIPENISNSISSIAMPDEISIKDPEKPSFHYIIFQKNSIFQEQFMKETSFSRSFVPNSGESFHFNKWQIRQLRKESHEGYEEIDAKYENYDKEVSEKLRRK